MHHFRLYLRLLNVQLVSQIQYRTSFIFQLLGTALISSLEFASLALAMQRFEFLGGWNIGEIAFLVGLVEVGFGAMDMIFSGFDPQYFGQSIRKGSFDQVLLRPIPSGVQVLGSDLGLRRIGAPGRLKGLGAAVPGQNCLCGWIGRNTAGQNR